MSSDNGDLIPTNISPQKVVNAQIKTNSTMKCINCSSDDHNFSPCPIGKKLPKELVFCRINDNTNDSNGKYTVKIVSDPKNQKFDESRNYESYTPDITDIRANHAIFWSDGLPNLTNNLVSLISKTDKKINKQSVLALIKAINCPKWWEDFLLMFAKKDMIVKEEVIDDKTVIIEQPLEKSIELAKRIKMIISDILEDKELNIVTLLSDYNFSIYTAKLRTLNDKLQKVNEGKAINKFEENEVRKRTENEAKAKIDMEIREKAREEIMLIETSNVVSLNQFFINNLNKYRKSHDARYIAAITPDSTVFADLIMKLGVKSTLQDGIDFEFMKQKATVWKFYKIQQELFEEGKIKFKKVKWVDPKLKVDENIIPTIPNVDDDNLDIPRTELKLTQPQQMKYKEAYKEFKNFKKNGIPGTKLILDDWQIKSITAIREGRSCLITGPTSGGKTFVMMDGLNNIISNFTEDVIIVVSPTFHLAYQTYANVIATFPTKSIAIITSELIFIPKDAKILIGTACEILNYLITKNIRFQVGIFDEIHVASKTYCDESSPIEINRARSYARLLSKCERQAIAASATLVNENGMIQFMINQLNQNRSSDTQMQIEDIELIKYTIRAVPLQEYRYNTSIEPIKRDTVGIEESITTDEKLVDIDSKNLLKLLFEMRNRNITPTIIFEKSDDLSWNTYSTFVDYIENIENAEYLQYNRMIDMINKKIESFNEQYKSKMSDIPEDDKVDSTRIRVGVKGNNKRESVINSIKKLREETLNNIISESITHFDRAIINFNSERPDSICIISKNKIEKDRLRDISRLLGKELNKLIDSDNFIISNAHLDMLTIITSFEENDGEQVDIINPIKIEKGSFFKFSKASYCTDLLKAIRSPGENEESWKHRKKMIALAEAQNIHPKDIDNITDVILRGLEFGIGIISNSLPFVIQNIILESLQKKDMGIVFASESMSMGINYALRSVIIKSNKVNSSINPSKLIQMAGRCGRRGLDTEAHVIYWGIDNAHEAHHNFIPPISYPNDFYLDSSLDNTGSIISNYEELAIYINDIYVTKYFESYESNANLSSYYSKNGGNQYQQKEKEMKNKNNYNNYSKYNNYVEEKEDDNLEDEYINQLATNENNSNKRSEYLKPIILKIARIAKFSEEVSNELADMICDLDENLINISYCVNSFQKSQNIKILMSMMIELHNHYAASSNTVFLNFIEKIMIIFRSSCNKLIKYAK